MGGVENHLFYISYGCVANASDTCGECFSINIAALLSGVDSSNNKLSTASLIYVYFKPFAAGICNIGNPPV